MSSGPRGGQLADGAEDLAAIRELAALTRWVVWRLDTRGGKVTKVPYQPTGQRADTTNPETWVTFATARQAAATGAWDGIGFVFAEGDPYAGVDLDKCVNPTTGEVELWAAEIVGRLASYAEISPSGTGVKVFVRGVLPAGARRRGQIEMYDAGRYFTVTGRLLNGAPTSIEDRAAELAALHGELCSPPARPAAAAAATPIDVDDVDLVEKALRAANGADFGRLWGGDWSGYGSQSEADLALAAHLSFWTGGDPARVDRLFRQSRLWRPKWDERRGDDTYGGLTIAKAIGGASRFYAPTGRAAANGHHGTSAEPDQGAMASVAAPSSTSPAAAFASPYDVVGGRLCWRKASERGEMLVPLANFDARVVREVLAVDGLNDPRSELEIEGTLADGRSLGLARVPTNEFAAMNWPLARWGLRAVIGAGNGTKDRLREAIQLRSGEPPQRWVYEHTGWLSVDGAWVYLSGSGGIGAEGLVESFEVALTGPLERFKLPRPPVGDELVAAVHASLALWTLGPATLMAPLLAATYLAPLRELLGDAPPDLAIWLHGRTQVFKSELSALLQAHYGNFTRTTLPASFISSANAIGGMAAAAKDALLVVDDYHPPQDLREQQTMAAIAGRLLRGAGNGMGRSRMMADTRLRAEASPRCIVLITAERQPEGQSNAARTLPVPMESGMIGSAELTAAQQRRGLLARAMAGYVRWLAGHFEELSATLPARFLELRAEAAKAGDHARAASQVAYLQLALTTWLEFAVDVGAISDAARDDRHHLGWAGLLGLASQHARQLAGEAPEERFRALLIDGFRQRRIYLEALGGGAPADAHLWGWEPYASTDLQGAPTRRYRHLQHADTLGHVDDDCLLLFPEATWQFVYQAARSAGQPIGLESDSMLRRLAESNAIYTVAAGNRVRRQPQVRIAGQRQSVIKLRRDFLVAGRDEDDAES